MENDEKKQKSPKKVKKMTNIRLKNIALYYLQRFDSSVDNLRQVLKRRVYDYARQATDFDINEAHEWIETLLSDFEKLGYLNDERYAEFKITSYLESGKPARYIKIKMKQKGVADDIVDKILSDSEVDEKQSALKFAQKKKIGPYRADEEAQKLNRQKDLAAMVRAGFDYETSKNIIGGDFYEESI